MAFEIRTKRLLEGLAAAICLLAAGCTQPVTDQPLTTAESSSGKVEQLLRMGERSLAGGDPVTARGLYSQAISLDGSNIVAARGLGDALLQLGSAQEASEAFARGLALQPSDRLSTIGYAKAMIDLGRVEAAVAHLEPLAAREGDDPAVLNLTGVAYDLSGDHARAGDLYRRGLDIDPGSVNLRNNLGLSMALAGEPDPAIELLEPLIAEQPGSIRARQNLALVYGLSGNVTAAARLSRLDLDESDVENNLAYMEMLRSLPPSVPKSAPFRPAVKPVADAAGPARGGKDLVFGVALDGEDLSLGLSPVGSWVLNLGRFSDGGAVNRGWDTVRRDHGAIMAGMNRLGGAGQGPQPLLVGPIASAREAQDLCEELQTRNQSCQPIKL